MKKIRELLKCSICDQVITKDRFNFAVEWERQDVPCESDWQKSYEVPTEDICNKCFDKCINYFTAFRNHLRANKGVIKHD